MQLAIEIYIYIYLARHRRQPTSEKIHKKGTGESTGDKRRETFGKRREAVIFIIITFYNFRIVLK